MASAVVGSLRVILGLDSAEFEAGTREAQKALAGWSKDFGKMGQQATALGGTLTAALTVPIVGLAAGSVKAAMDFETSFANVRKTVNATEPELDALAMTFRRMAKEIPLTTDELNNIAALGGQMGVPIEQMASFTRNVAALGVAVDGISTEEAAAGLAQIGNIAGTGTTKIAEMASTLVHLGNSSNATEADILEFTKRLTGAGTTIGLTVPEVMALGTTMANVGINAEAGGTAMSQVITKISKAVSKGGSDLAKFAQVADMSSAEFAKSFKEKPIEAIDAFVSGLGTMKRRGVDLNLTMGEIGTSGERVGLTLKSLAGAQITVADSTKIANEGWASGTKHLEEAEKKYATTANQLKLLWASIKDVGITLGNAMLPALQSAVKIVGSLMPLLDGMAKIFAALPAPIQLGALAFAAVLAAVGPLMLVFGQMAFAAQSLTAAFTANGIATKLLAGNMVTLSAAMSVLGGVVAVAGTAWVAWKFGTWIGEVTGLTNAVQSLTEKVMGYRDASEPLESQQKLINQAIKLGADETVTFAEAMAFLQKRAADLRASSAEAAGAIKEQGKQTKTTTVSTDAATKAQASYNKEIQSYISKLTGADLQQEVKKLTDAYNKLTPAQRENTFFTKQFTAEILRLADAGAILPPKFDDIARKAQATRAQLEMMRLTTQDFNAAVKAMGPAIDLSLPRFVEAENFFRSKMDPTLGGMIGKIQDLGYQIKELPPPPPDPWLKWKETAQRAIDDISGGMATSITDMLTGQVGFKDGLVGIWQSIKSTLLGILDDILQYFIGSFLKGMLQGILGANLGKALGGSIASGLTGAAGAAASGGASAAAGAAGAGGSAAGGAALGALGTAALFALPVAAFFLATSGKEWDPNQGWYDYMAAQEAKAGTSFWDTPEGKAIAEDIRLNPGNYGTGEMDFSGLTGGLTPDAGDVMPDFGASALSMIQPPSLYVPQGAAMEGSGWDAPTMTVVFEEDGRQKAQYMVPFIEEEVMRLRLA